MKESLSAPQRHLCAKKKLSKLFLYLLPKNFIEILGSRKSDDSDFLDVKILLDDFNELIDS